MFRVIEPKEYNYYRARIDLFLGLIRLNQNLSLSYEEQACSTFIIGEEEEGLVWGGAILHKQPINNLPNQISSSLSTDILNIDYVWVCTLALCFENTKDLSKSRFPQAFYRELLKKLNEFGKRENIRVLCLTLNPLEHLRIKNKEVLSCSLEIDPKKSLDGLFYGVLPLPQQKSKPSVDLHNHPSSFKHSSSFSALSFH